MGFQKNVLIVALVILVIMIIIMTAVIEASEGKKKWPPEISTCPPYYKLTYDSNVPQCEFIDTNRTIGEIENSTNCKKFSLVQGGRPASASWKKTWAQRCKVNWDGISE